jgi:hypothetical protein
MVVSFVCDGMDGRFLERRGRDSPPRYQRDHEKNEKNNEQQPRDVSRRRCNATEAEHAGNDGNDQK